MYKSTVIMPLNQSFDRLSDYYWYTANELVSQGCAVYAYEAYKEAQNLRKILSKHRHPFSLVRQIKSNLWSITPFHWIPLERIPFIYKSNIKLSLILSLIYIRLNTKGPWILWLFHPRFYWMIEIAKLILGKQLKVVYETPDYLTSSSPLEEKQLRYGEKVSMSAADVCSTNCPAIVDLLGDKYPQLVCSPAGFKLNEFKKYADKKNTRQKIVGYCGSINYRIDYEFVSTVCKKSPQIQFEFLGPIYLEDFEDEEDISPLQQELFSLPNVTHIDKVGVKKMIEIMSRWRVAIIPYQTDISINTYANPTKLMDYFYLKIPVLSSNLLGLKSYQNQVYLSNSTSKWTEFIRSHVGFPSLTNYRQIAVANSWKARVGFILSKLTQSEPLETTVFNDRF